MTVNEQRIPITRVDELPPGSMRAAVIADRTVLLANVDGTLYAVSGECTHDGAPLVDGELDGDTVVCPWHFSRFCLRTGEVIESPAEDALPTLAVDVVDGAVFVR